MGTAYSRTFSYETLGAAVYIRPAVFPCGMSKVSVLDILEEGALDQIPTAIGDWPKMMHRVVALLTALLAGMLVADPAGGAGLIPRLRLAILRNASAEDVPSLARHLRENDISAVGVLGPTASGADQPRDDQGGEVAQGDCEYERVALLPHPAEPPLTGALGELGYGIQTYGEFWYIYDQRVLQAPSKIEMQLSHCAHTPPKYLVPMQVDLCTFSSRDGVEINPRYRKYLTIQQTSQVLQGQQRPQPMETVELTWTGSIDEGRSACLVVPGIVCGLLCILLLLPWALGRLRTDRGSDKIPHPPMVNKGE